MLPALVVVALVAVVLAVVAIRARRDLAARTAELAARDDELAAAQGELAQAQERLAAADAARAHTEAERDAARAEAAEAGERADSADAARIEAESAAAASASELAEAATLAARLVDDGAADPAALWMLEQVRSERTWRHSVAAVHGDPSPLVAARHPLWTALEIEVAAVREEVGAIVDLDVDLPGSVTPGASLATLRVAQELLAAAVHQGEVTILRVAADGADLVVEATAVDADGTAVPLAELALPPSRFDAEPGLVRLRGALDPTAADPA